MSAASTSHRHVTENGAETHYILQGIATGRLVVLLHGLGGSTRTFEPLLSRLPLQTHRILSVDFEGFGNSPLKDPSVPLSIDRYVADVDNLIAHVQSDRTSEEQDNTKRQIIIIGHSLGAIVALHYAAQHPSAVGGLALLCANRSASHIPTVRERMLALAVTVRRQGIRKAGEIAASSNFPSGDGTSDAMRREVQQTVEVSNPEAYAQICEAMVSPSHRDPDYGAITCPVSLVSGLDDIISPPSRADDLKPLFAGACTISLVKGGHQPILSDIEATHRAIELILR